MSLFSSPYPGLRPFDAEEGDLFFGREDQVDELLRRLHSTRFLAVVGPSGCGKSSLVRAGMIAALESGFLVSAGSHWQFAVMRPGGRPMTELAKALVTQTVLAQQDAEPDGATDTSIGLLGATLRRGPLGLVEVLRETPLPPGTNLLVLVDQFEEIFRFRREGGIDEADAFVALLLESARQRDLPIYVVLTMRSDFFGDCAAFGGLPEALNRSQYLTPRLSREQRRAAIVGPARVYGGDVAPELVNRLLNEMGNDPDQLPLMQHLLMRMWTWHTPPAAGVGEQVGEMEDRSASGVGHTLTLDDYSEVGGLRNALSDHANEAFARLDARQRAIAETLFRRLSERAPGARDIRHPTLAGDAAVLAEATLPELIAVVDVFRAPGCSFVVPAWPHPIDAVTVLDITHEALIRQWDRLRQWADDEAQSADHYRFLEQNAQRWKQGRMALWGTPNLEMALDWKERVQPTALWAARYAGDFALAMEFLELSANARAAEESTRQERRQRQVRHLRRVTATSVLAALLCIGAVGGGYWFLFAEHVGYYQTYVKRWGEPVGIGALTDEQVRHRELSLKVVQRGIHYDPNSRWFYTFTTNRIEAIDAEGHCTPDNGVRTYLSKSDQGFSLGHECSWLFVRDATTGQVIYENAYDKNGNMRWGYEYLPGQNEKSSRRAYYVGPNGSLAHFSNSPASVILMTYSKRGEEIKDTYFDRENSPQPGPDHAYGRKYEYAPSGRQISITSLDEFGKNLNDTVGNAILGIEYDAAGNATRDWALDAAGQPTLFKKGYFAATFTYDGYGNELSEAFLDKDGSPALHAEGFHIIRTTRDNEGHATSYSYFDRDGKPTLSTEGYHRLEVRARGPYGQLADWAFFDTQGHNSTNLNGVHEYRKTYDANGFATSEQAFGNELQPVAAIQGCYEMRMGDNQDGEPGSMACFDKDGKPALNNIGAHSVSFLYDDRGHIVERKYFDRDGSPATIDKRYHREVSSYDPFGNLKEDTYFDIDGRPVNNTDGYQRYAATYDHRGNATSISYFDQDKRPVLGPKGYARRTAKYDEHDNPVETAWYAADNQPTATSKEAPGYALLRRRFDERWRQTEAAYFDVHGNSTLVGDGYAILQTSYDGEFNDERYLNTAGQPVRINGCAIGRQSTGQTAGKTMETICLDEDGHRATEPNGVSLVRKTYDDRGNIVEEAYVGADDKPVPAVGGAASIRYRYDNIGRITEASYRGMDGNPIPGPGGAAIIRRRYDGVGHPVESTRFDAAGKLTIGPGGYAIERDQYDDHGKLVEATFFGPDENPIALPEGYHRVVTRYDDRGNVIQKRAYGPDGKLVAIPDGYAIHRTRYDDHGRVLEHAYFGPDQTPALLWNNYHRVSWRYDERGDVTEEAYYGVDGKLLMQSNKGYAVQQTRYDDQGHLVQEIRLGSDGKPIAPGSGWYRREVQYGPTGNMLEEATYDGDGKLVSSYQGFAMSRAEQAVYGPDRHLIAHCTAGANETAAELSQCMDTDGHPVTRRIAVQKVIAGGQAETTGIRPGDVLESYAGHEILDIGDLPHFTAEKTEGTRKLVVWRGTQMLEFGVKPGAVGIYMEVLFVPKIAMDAGQNTK